MLVKKNLTLALLLRLLLSLLTGCLGLAFALIDGEILIGIGFAFMAAAIAWSGTAIFMYKEINAVPIGHKVVTYILGGISMVCGTISHPFFN